MPAVTSPTATLRAIGVAAAVACVASLPRNASADEPAAFDARTAEIQAILDATQGPSRLWYYGWLSAYSASTIAQGVVWGATTDAPLRAGARVGTVTSAIGVISTLVMPTPFVNAASRLRRAPAATPLERADKAKLAEALLASSAEAQRDGRSVWMQLGGLLVNGGAGLYLWLHDDQAAQGALAFAGGMAVCELQIFTQPMGAARAAVDRASVWVVPTLGGASVVGQF